MQLEQRPSLEARKHTTPNASARARHSTAKAATTEQLAVTVTASALGQALIAFSQHGIKAILLGDGERELRRDLQRRFPNAQLVETTKDHSVMIQKVLSKIENPARAIALPLDIDGTDFQKKVWFALQDVRAGTTITYSTIAKAIGRPAATRAVASACASNPLAVIIPCHRVVRKDGGLSGYRWGIERKRTLLTWERSR